MKREIYILLFLLCAIATMAQDLKVESFSATTQILQADKRKVDSNGDPCAVVEVLLPDDGANFVGNLVGSPQFNINKYWVYMTEGSKQLQINLKGYNALNVYFGDYGVNRLVQNIIYELKVSKPTKNEVQTQTLSLRVTPANAIVLIDGDIQKTASGQATLTLPVGSHTYNVVADGYIKQQGVVKLATDVPGKLIIELDKINKVTSQQAKTVTATTEQELTLFELEEQYEKAKKLYDKKEYSKAVPILTMLAEKGNADAQTYLGICYYYGDGVSQDCSKAVEWYTKAANNGNRDAQCNLGICYYEGSVVPQDYSKAVEWYTKAAKQGLARAQCHLGDCYYYGHGVVQDCSKAVEWFTKAANQGNADAQCNLGDCYTEGYGVSKDDSKAVEWYTKAANKGHARAQCNLGVCYAKGQGVPQDDSKAVEWYTKAANQGDAISQYNLGFRYENGQSVNKDLQKAIELYTKAAKQGQSNAKTRLERLGVSY